MNSFGDDYGNISTKSSRKVGINRINNLIVIAQLQPISPIPVPSSRSIKKITPQKIISIIVVVYFMNKVCLDEKKQR